MKRPMNHYKCIGCGKEYNTYKYYPLGWICLGCRPTTKINVKCSVCGCDVPVFWNTYRMKDPNIPWRCRACNDAYRNEVYENRPEEDKKAFIESQIAHIKDYWANLSQEERDDDSKRRKGLWKKRKETGEADFILSRLKEGRANWWNSLTEEQQRAEILRLGHVSKENWDSMTPEELVEYKNSQRLKGIKRWDKIPKSKRKELLKPLREANEEFWKNMTPEEFVEWSKKMKTGYNQYLNEVNPYSGSPTRLSVPELMFVNKIKLERLDYEFQHLNTKIHPDFFKLFPINKMTGGYENPYHSWDFVIHTKDSDVLVDVDGSIHFKDTFVRTLSDGRQVKELDIKQYADSKRPYQTDGLPAYVILSINDRIEDNTAVKNITNGTIMTFKAFMALLSFMNSTDAEKREIANA